MGVAGPPAVVVALTSVTGRGYETGDRGSWSAAGAVPGAGRVRLGLGYSADMSRPATLGDLRASGWESRPVKDEVRANAIARVAAGESPFAGVLGFEDTVIPQLENALLAGPRRDLPR